MKTKLKQKSP